MEFRDRVKLFRSVTGWSRARIALNLRPNRVSSRTIAYWCCGHVPHSAHYSSFMRLYDLHVSASDEERYEVSPSSS